MQITPAKISKCIRCSIDRFENKSDQGESQKFIINEIFVSRKKYELCRAKGPCHESLLKLVMSPFVTQNDWQYINKISVPKNLIDCINNNNQSVIAQLLQFGVQLHQ